MQLPDRIYDSLPSPRGVALGAATLLGGAAVYRANVAVLDTVRANHGEVLADCEDLVPEASVTSDSAFVLDASPEAVFARLAQIGPRPEGRGGWPLPRSAELVLRRKDRAPREYDGSVTPAQPGNSFVDWMSPSGSDMVRVHTVEAPSVLVFNGQRREIRWSMAFVVRSAGEAQTQVLAQTRMGPFKRPGLAAPIAEHIDRMSMAGLAAGLQERFTEEKILPKSPSQTRLN